MTKTGDFGALILSGANTYTGATTVAGTLRAGAANAFSAASAVTLGGGATLDLNNYDQTIGSLAGYWLRDPGYRHADDRGRQHQHRLQWLTCREAVDSPRSGQER